MGAVASCLSSIVSAIADVFHTIFSAIGSILHTITTSSFPIHAMKSHTQKKRRE
uniref:Uncharacterized protein n=1 Tax=Melanopsichium pennsylvanicum 4 TaxID=1398559 RepID=A0A077R1B6_9BASI|nr:conserved hypothetical protein [Melanopsichium pennsylvanicum 4]